LYDDAIQTAPPGAQQSAAYHGNSAACHFALEDFKACVSSCTAALAINASYTKVLKRRMNAFEKLDELENALNDARRVRKRDANFSIMQ
jgi:hypothetical protein